MIEAIQFLHEGGLGRVYHAQSTYTSLRPDIGTGKLSDPPAGLDYALWQGPAPHKPFKTNYLHYNWHWFWHWGNGELGNNGIHTIDVCRWGLQVGHPAQVTSTGGRYRYEDEQETPDTNFVTYTYPNRKSITWKGLSCNRIPGSKPADENIVFYGENGSLSVADDGYTIFDTRGKEVKKVVGSGDIANHVGNFLEAIRGNAKLNSPIEEGSISTSYCHLGNIAYRVGHSLSVDPTTGRPTDADAMKLWRRDYQPGWEPKV